MNRCVLLLALALAIVATSGCGNDLAYDQSRFGGGSTSTSNSDASTSSGGSADDASSNATGDSSVPACPYTDDKQFCACLGNYTCGADTVRDNSGTNRPVFCGACGATQYCDQLNAANIVSLGTCADNPYVKYEWQRQKINMLVSMGENDNTIINYASCANLMDGRGYSIGQVGFTTGTGDFILVAQCYNDGKPNNILSKYWPALVYYNNRVLATGKNQADTSKIDALGNFPADVAFASAEADGIFDRCQDAVGDGLNMAAAVGHAKERGFQGLLTVGFLYDTEINFGDEDDSGGLGGTITVMKRADADYAKAMPLPTDFTGQTWEESRWLGFLIQERVVEMSGNATWMSALDQNATWEAARRLNTATTNTPESATDLGMDYDIVSQYKSGSPVAGTPCWSMPPLLSNADTMSTVFDVSIDKSAGPADENTWKATGLRATVQSFLPCPANVTP